MRMFISRLNFRPKGNILLFAIIFGFISFSVIIVGVSGYAISENRASVKKHNREMAFQIADAGINYYRWHLAHTKTDYQDGTGQAGPYEHEYSDKDGNVIGRYSLNITPPPSGSTVVTIESTGWLDSQSESKRKLRARVGFASMTDYAFITKVSAWIGDTEVTHGKFHANGGIRYDGTGDAPITSSVPEYLCKADHNCTNQMKPGVWGAGGPQSYWSFPVPAQNFDGITAKLADILDGASIPGQGLYFGASGQQGWRLQFLANGTIQAYKVTATNCYKGRDPASNKFTWPCLDIKTIEADAIYNMPANGFIYVEDMVWVDGIINGRATVGTAAGKSIIVNGNLTYIAKDGNHVLGLIGEKDVLVPHDSPDNLEINAAILAQKGGAKRYEYPGDKKTSLTTYGSVITAGVWTWSYVSNGGVVMNGYVNTNATYDANLTYGPPPGFPVGSEYNLISWEEVKL